MPDYRHARDIPDRLLLETVDQMQRQQAERYRRDLKWTSVTRWDLAEQFGRTEAADRGGAPDPIGKLVLAKARRLIRRGLLDGCYCGCRGDLKLTERGQTMLDSLPPAAADLDTQSHDMVK